MIPPAVVGRAILPAAAFQAAFSILAVLPAIALAQDVTPVFDGRLTLKPTGLSAPEEALMRDRVAPAARRAWHERGVMRDAKPALLLSILLRAHLRNHTPCRKPFYIGGLADVRALAAGAMHALALKDDGTVWSWGYNHDSQLGNTRVMAEESTKPVRTGTLSGVVAIAAAANHSAAVTSQGVVWAWGQSDQDSGKVIRICGRQDSADIDKWSGIQYRFGPEACKKEPYTGK